MISKLTTHVQEYFWNDSLASGADLLSVSRERIFYAIFITAAIVGSFIYITSSAYSIRHGLWVNLLVHTLGYLLLLGIILVRRIPFKIRVWMGVLLVYLLGVFALFANGLPGSARVYLFSFSIVTCLLLGFKAGLVSLILNFITMIIVGWMVNTDYLVLSNTPNAKEIWFIISLTFLWLNSIIIVSLSVLIRNLELALIREEKDSRELSVSHVQIEKKIDEEKQLRTALQKSEKQYKKLYSMMRLMSDNLPDLIWTKDLEHRFIFANKACCEKMLNAKDTDEPIGKTDLYFAAREKKSHPENPDYHTFGETCTNSDLAVIETKKTQKFEEAGNLKGRFVCFDVYKTPFWDEKGNLIGTVGCARDITKEKEINKKKLKLESQLRQAQKMEAIGTLAGGIAHDFNNILFPVFGYLEMMMADVPEDNPLFDDLTMVLNGAKRARDLVKQIVMFSRQTEHEKKPLKVQLIIREVLKLTHSSLPTTIDIRQDISDECGLVIADPTQIHQIAMNLITNAYHAMEKTGGNLTIKLKEIELTLGDLKDPAMVPGTHVCLTIADTGPGMDQSVIARIFDPYFTTKENGKGTGMGLAIVHGIVKSHGGHISVYSEPGKGTEFKVCLPVIKLRKTIQRIEPDLLPIQKGNERVLLVDDEDIIVQVERKMLERLGYQVTVRASSIDALEAFRANPDNFDFVITDMTMPNMSGDRLAVELNKIRPGIPILLCTGFSETMSEEKAAFIGIKGVLLKPVTMKNFADKIREMLDNEDTPVHM
ncbi:MAG: response regulator [Desulfobacula sp.]|uniref:PAS domain-containing sensor histidine kinase n=1 Tax=Desulfobacula sp. TaxID=2593537 RepID=UPI0025C4724B|nr:PAS domain-containing sensor histidine kinase [Desulfobacula sp.]MCD4719289.1 response regulator [Desulfobacula sp.]